MTLQWFSIQILVNFYIFELSSSLFLTTLGFRLPVVNGDLSPMKLQEMFSTVWKFTNLYGKPLNWVTGWQVQNLLIFSCGCDRYLWDTRPNIYRLPNFETLFQFLLTTVFVFSKSWSHDQLMQKTHLFALACKEACSQATIALNTVSVPLLPSDEDQWNSSGVSSNNWRISFGIE